MHLDKIIDDLSFGLRVKGKDFTGCEYGHVRENKSNVTDGLFKRIEGRDLLRMSSPYTDAMG